MTTQMTWYLILMWCLGTSPNTTSGCSVTAIPHGFPTLAQCEDAGKHNVKTHGFARYKCAGK